MIFQLFKDTLEVASEERKEQTKVIQQGFGKLQITMGVFGVLGLVIIAALAGVTLSLQYKDMKIDSTPKQQQQSDVRPS
jgi:hypothetical protein